MARKKTLPSPVPEPDVEEETSEQESRESEDGEEGEESEEAVEEKGHKNKGNRIQPSQVNKKPLVQKQTTAATPAPDSPSSPNVSDFTVKPISPARQASKDAKATPKRKSQERKDDGKDLKSRKRAKSSGGDEKEVKVSAVSASGAFVRVWSEEDEISVLEGMIDYQKSKGVNPSNDMAAFHEFIKGKLSGDMSKTQLYEKVRRFKKKFFTNVEKAERTGKDPVFSNARESKAFELSKKIWADEANSSGGISGIGKEGEKKGAAKVGKIVKGGEKDVGMDDVMDDGGDFESKFPHLCQSFDLDGLSFLRDDLKSYLRENLSVINSAKAKELEEQWKKLSEQEAEFLFKKMSLMGEQTVLVLNALKER